MIKIFLIAVFGFAFISCQSTQSIKKLYLQLNCRNPTGSSESSDAAFAGKNESYRTFFDCQQVEDLARLLKPIINTTYNLLDYNPKDGKITWEEISSTLRSLDINPVSSERERFKHCDVDNSNGLDFDEYSRAAVLSYGTAKMAVDFNRDNQMSLNEIRFLIKRYSSYAYKTVSVAEQLGEIGKLRKTGDESYSLLDIAQVDTNLFETFASRHKNERPTN